MASRSVTFHSRPELGAAAAGDRWPAAAGRPVIRVRFRGSQNNSIRRRRRGPPVVLPGCGRSADPPPDFRLSDYADTLAAFVDRLGLVRPHVVGLPSGSSVALELYRRHPDIPRTLILAWAYAGWAGSLSRETVAARLRQGLRQSEMPPEQVVAAWMPTLFPDTVAPKIADRMSKIMSDFHPAGMRTMLQAFARADLRGVRPVVDVPVLLLYGAKDERSPLAVAQRLRARIPAARLVIIPGVGHLANMEAPAVFNAVVRRFLRTH